MKYLHTMVRVTDLDASLEFYCDALGLRRGAPHASTRRVASRWCSWRRPAMTMRRSS